MGSSDPIPARDAPATTQGSAPEANAPGRCCKTRVGCLLLCTSSGFMLVRSVPPPPPPPAAAAPSPVTRTAGALRSRGGHILCRSWLCGCRPRLGSVRLVPGTDSLRLSAPGSGVAFARLLVSSSVTVQPGSFAACFRSASRQKLWRRRIKWWPAIRSSPSRGLLRLLSRVGILWADQNLDRGAL